MTTRHLRCAAIPTLVVRLTDKTTLGDRVFAVSGARAWNALSSLRMFRHCLKTELFSLTFFFFVAVALLVDINADLKVKHYFSVGHLHLHLVAQLSASASEVIRHAGAI